MRHVANAGVGLVLGGVLGFVFFAWPGIFMIGQASLSEASLPAAVRMEILAASLFFGMTPGAIVGALQGFFSPSQWKRPRLIMRVGALTWLVSTGFVWFIEFRQFVRANPWIKLTIVGVTLFTLAIVAPVTAFIGRMFQQESDGATRRETTGDELPLFGGSRTGAPLREAAKLDRSAQIRGDEYLHVDGGGAGFSVNYINDWLVVDPSDDFVRSGGLLSVVRRDGAASLTISCGETHSDWSVPVNRANESFTRIRSRFGGSPIQKLPLSNLKGERQVVHMQFSARGRTFTWSTVIEDRFPRWSKQYVFLYTATADGQPDIARILDSWKWYKSKGDP